MDGIQQVKQALAACGLDPALVRQLPADTSTAEAAAQAVNAPLGSIVKSLVFLADGVPLLVLVAGDRRADVHRLRAALELSKKRLRIAQPAEVLALTGFEVGGVPPLGHRQAVRTLIDRSLGRFDIVWAAAGSANAVFPIAYDRLVAITNGQVMDLVEEPDSLDPERQRAGEVGVMAVQDCAPNAFSEEHARFLSTIAGQVAVSIENARLYQETEQRLRELSALFDTSAALSTTLDMDEVLAIIARQVTAILGADACAISTWDRERDALVVMLDYSPSPGYQAADAPGTVYPLADYPASRRVLRDRRPLAVQAGDPDADPAEVRLMQDTGMKTLLMVPMIARGDAVGLLEPRRIHEERPFSPTEIGLVQTMANQAAAALENARLYEEVKQASQAKSEFIDFVAHELKQPMTSMQGYARMLTMGIGGEMTAMQKQFVQVIISNVDRMGKLVNDLLEISRLEAGRTKLKLEPVHLREVVDETLTRTRPEIEARQHTLEVSAPDDLPPVMGDRERLVQILTNLVSNAYKYTPNGGTIRIAVDGRDRPDVPPGHLLVSVSDTGIGMSPQELAGLEEKFFRADHPLVREQPGTGLGVSITRGLVALHGGELIIETGGVGQGSTFRFTVPVAA
jgi:signal transduction histidine kinase/prolyl-tRNA editing enzyme YbaK/EbsC (Cys-tRNA(Pro) deacylase)